MTPDLVASEEDLVQGFLAPLSNSFPGAFGLRDDAALLTARPADPGLVVTMDAIAEGVHFLPGDPAADVGWKALAVNVSDLIAKGADPIAYTMALSFPEPPSRDWMAGFAAGLGQAQSAFGCHLIGGDSDRRSGPITVTITAIGSLGSAAFVPRTAARPGMVLYVTGTLGDAALGLAVRRRETRTARWQLTPGHSADLQERYLRPAPPHALRTAIARNVSAAMDLSDGLAKDLGRMAAASGVAARVELARLPVSAAVAAALEIDPAVYGDVIAGGDDYQALCAVMPERAKRFEEDARSVGIRVERIGCISEGSGVEFLDRDGQPANISPEGRGYDHFGPSRR